MYLERSYKQLAQTFQSIDIFLESICLSIYPFHSFLHMFTLFTVSCTCVIHVQENSGYILCFLKKQKQKFSIWIIFCKCASHSFAWYFLLSVSKLIGEVCKSTKKCQISGDSGNEELNSKIKYIKSLHVM